MELVVEVAEGFAILGPGGLIVVASPPGNKPGIYPGAVVCVSAPI